ncbi:hypothetical protein QMK17_12205 [Rhodococcus sp. G-MC3]|uniref:hypothetical protein n=1 Tax=Rhodococcus sp. G-MC3 TaxID=3046209 RepID=UPI0024B8E863|nr:hypothetical protein [Rhodococcus sp. G-MC3]MDJ0394091.1 hypothetical protein [Rhodococcus sp. G-MC3]
MKSVVWFVLACAVSLTVVAACSSEPDSEDAITTTSATGSAGESSSPDGIVIDISIDGGAVSPTNERLDATVGEPITLRVDSDSEDELHVHSVPDHEFEVAAAPGQSFVFTVDVPGQVAIELHASDRTVATVSVRP